MLEVRNLKKYFKAGNGWLHAVDDISIKLEEGKTLGIVGESGCGKSTFGRMVTLLLDSTEGKIFFEGEDVTNLKKDKLKAFRQKVQMIFQDPYSSLDPRMSVSEIITEPLIYKGDLSHEDMDKKTSKLMDIVGLASRCKNSYPHELDGGRRQRIGIARALSLNPKFIVCDEPVSALDVSVQAQVLNLLMDLQEEMKLTYFFVTHDLSVVKHISNEIVVMYLGQMVEKAESNELFKHPFHPYTKALLSAILEPNIHSKKERIILKGEITSPINPKSGCRFEERCMFAKTKCHESQVIEEVLPGHFVSCCRVREINSL